MTTWQHWLRAFRLRTLPLALSSIAMGGFLAADAGAFRSDIFVLCVLTTVFLQILSNLANDYGDSVHGADSLHRKGPSRMVQSGAITLGQMRTAMAALGALSLFSGVFLLWVAFGWNWRAFLFFLFLGLLCILAAITYTVGKRPYGYSGLGDLSVLVFFGFVGVMGSYYLFTKTLSGYELLPALSLGFFSVAVLNINNIRDIESDTLAGKYSVPVRIGRRKAIVYHWILLFLAISCSVAYTFLKLHSSWQFIFIVAVPLFVYNAMAVKRKPPELLDPCLRQMAISTLVFVLLFGVGLAVE